MTDRPEHDVSEIDGESLYSTPSEAISAAQETLADPGSSPSERTTSLLILGRAAYYANQITEAVSHLQQAIPLATDRSTLAEILLTLAPALSKLGRPEDALALLDGPVLQSDARNVGQLLNQRGIILAELGRLPEGMADLEHALPLLREAGDHNREARTLVNLGAMASMIGDLDAAERWYAASLLKISETGQTVVSAGVEGNLGYVESRRGNFAAALAWYNRARASFTRFGDVDLLVANLEVDHARTLLDVGLSADAASAAEIAIRSATAGGNRMLEMQSQLLLTEALIELSEHRAAKRSLATGSALAEALGLAPWKLQAAELSAMLQPNDQFDASVLQDQTDALLEAGWVREAHAVAIHHAQRLRETDQDEARRLLVRIGELTDGLDVDPVRKSLVDLLLAEIDGDHHGAGRAFGEALKRIGELKDLLGSLELRTTVGRRTGPLLDAALSVAVRSDDPAKAVLQVLEQLREVTFETRTRTTSHPNDLMIDLRNARVALDEAKLAGGELDQAHAQVRQLETSLLRHRRQAIPAPTGTQPGVVSADRGLPADTTFLSYIVHRDRLLALRQDQNGTDLVDLGAPGPLRRLARTQQAALRRVVDERRNNAARSFEQMETAARSLDAALIEPLNLSNDRLVIAPGGALGDLSWTALPSLRGRRVTMSPSLSAWSSQAGALDISCTTFLSGPGLKWSSTELAELGDLWGPTATVLPNATSGQASNALRTADLVHVAAHGEFRGDNPFLSSILLADGQLTVLEMSELERLPAMVVLASCDASATASDGSEVVVSTATELRQLGTRVVIAPSVAINDAASKPFFAAFYGQLAGGNSVDDAVLWSRTKLWDSEEPRLRATSIAFGVFGGRLTRGRPQRSLSTS